MTSRVRPTGLLAMIGRLSMIGLWAMLAGSGCNERTVLADADTDDPPRPGPGEMFAECLAHEDCAPLPYCVFPAGDAGFCTQACPGGTPDGCDEPGAGNAPLDCVDVGSGEPVCALDCEDASCPFDMTCTGVATPAGDRRICF